MCEWLMHSPIAFASSTALKEQCMCYKLMTGKSGGRDRIYIHTQGSLAEITNQRFSLKCQTFQQLAAAFISGSGLRISCRNVWYFKENL